MSGIAVKYQVFISSTYEDLKEERDVVVKAVLEMGHIPVGMEMFSAGDDEQWKIIQSHIDDSDYYVVIVAHRYGSIWEGISFTEREYDYALKIGVPILGFVIDDQATWNPKFIEKERADELKAFVNKVKKKPVGFWKNKESLYGLIPIALMKQMTASPRAGWIRGTAAADPRVLAELSRLSSENAELRSRVNANSVAEPNLAIELDSSEFSVEKDGRDWKGRIRSTLIFTSRDGRTYFLPVNQIRLETKADKGWSEMAVERDFGASGLWSFQNSQTLPLRSGILTMAVANGQMGPVTVRWIVVIAGFGLKCSITAQLHSSDKVIDANSAKTGTKLRWSYKGGAITQFE